MMEPYNKIPDPDLDLPHKDAAGRLTSPKFGKKVLDTEGGTRFFHKHLSQKARAKKRARRKIKKASRR